LRSDALARFVDLLFGHPLLAHDFRAPGFCSRLTMVPTAASE